MTTELKHTPGPWRVRTAGSARAGQPFAIDEIYVYAPDTQDDTAVCADVIDPATQKPSEGNARLIAAAPELLEKLQRLEVTANTVAYCYEKRPENFAVALADLQDDAKTARELIAKATGAA